MSMTTSNTVNANLEPGSLTPEELHTAQEIFDRLAHEDVIIDLEEEGWQFVRHPEEKQSLTSILQNLVLYDLERDPQGALMVGDGIDAAVVRMPHLHEGDAMMLSFRINEHVAVATPEGWLIKMHGLHEHDDIEPLEDAFWQQVADVDRSLGEMVDRIASNSPVEQSTDWMFESSAAA